MARFVFFVRVATNPVVLRPRESEAAPSSLPSVLPLGKLGLGLGVGSFLPLGADGKLDAARLHASLFGAGVSGKFTLPASKPAFHPAPVRPVVHALYPGRPSNPFTSQHVVAGIREFATLIAAHAGKVPKVVNQALWTTHDFILLYRSWNDREVSAAERTVSLAKLGSGVCGVFAGLIDSDVLEKSSTGFNYIAMFGEHVASGNLTLSQSEWVELMDHQHAEEYAGLLKLGEIV